MRKIKGILSSDNVCYHSVQKLLSSHLLSKSLKIINKIMILPVALYMCETWSLILREEYILRIFENRLLRRLFRMKRDEILGSWRKCILRNFITFTLRTSEGE
jgi:hypothetical protein